MPNISMDKITFQRLVLSVNRNIFTKFIESIVVAIKIPCDNNCSRRNKKFVKRIEEVLLLCKIGGSINIT